MERLLQPDSTIAILLGASAWPLAGLIKAPSYRKSASAVKKWLIQSEGLGMEPDHIIDLFDSDQSASDQLDLVSEKAQEILLQAVDDKRPIQDVIVYYIGHGSTDNADLLTLLVRRTRQGLEDQTGLRVSDLARVLKVTLARQRQYVILDCCFSEAAAKTFIGMGDHGQAVAAMVRKDLEEKLEENPEEALPKRGGLLLCACPAKEIAYAKADDPMTLFSGALIDVLRNGDPDQPAVLSFADLRDAVTDRVIELRGTKAPRPVLHSVNQRAGDLSRLPAFVNPSAQAAAERARQLAAACEEAARRERKEAEQQQRLEAEAVEAERARRKAALARLEEDKRKRDERQREKARQAAARAKAEQEQAAKERAEKEAAREKAAREQAEREEAEREEAEREEAEREEAERQETATMRAAEVQAARDRADAAKAAEAARARQEADRDYNARVQAQRERAARKAAADKRAALNAEVEARRKADEQAARDRAEAQAAAAREAGRRKHEEEAEAAAQRARIATENAAAERLRIRKERIAAIKLFVGGVVLQAVISACAVAAMAVVATKGAGMAAGLLLIALLIMIQRLAVDLVLGWGNIQAQRGSFLALPLLFVVLALVCVPLFGSGLVPRDPTGADQGIVALLCVFTAPTTLYLAERRLFEKSRFLRVAGACSMIAAVVAGFVLIASELAGAVLVITGIQGCLWIAGRTVTPLIPAIRPRRLTGAIGARWRRR